MDTTATANFVSRFHARTGVNRLPIPNPLIAAAAPLVMAMAKTINRKFMAILTRGTFQRRSFPNFISRPLYHPIASSQFAEDLYQITVGRSFLYIHPFSPAVLFADNERAFCCRDYTGFWY